MLQTIYRLFGEIYELLKIAKARFYRSAINYYEPGRKFRTKFANRYKAGKKVAQSFPEAFAPRKSVHRNFTCTQIDREVTFKTLPSLPTFFDIFLKNISCDVPSDDIRVLHFVVYFT